jgi:hypothetical protein
LFSFNKAMRRAVSDYDIAHALSVNYTWIMPTPKALPSPAEWALGGWELGGIFTAQTGMPFTPVIGGDPLGLNTDDFDFPNRSTSGPCATAVNAGNPKQYINLNCFSLPLATPAIAAQCQAFKSVPGTCSNLIGNAGRNSLRGPGLMDLDFSLLKNNYVRSISEAFNVQFRAEVFNILNRANFLAPTGNNAIFDQSGNPVGGAGLITGTSTTSRQIQFALKVIW